MKRIYIAGKYSAPDVFSVFENMRRGMKMAVKVRQLGYAPFCPWMDFMYFFINTGEQFTLENCYEYSIEWLKVSNGILFLPDWQESHGALEEWRIANKSNIPVFFTLADLESYDF